MTMKKGFPRLLVPRPDPSKPRPAYKPQPAVAPEAVQHACRPVDHVKPPPRIVPTATDGRMPERPGAPEPAEKPVLPRPAFLTRGKPVPTPASERQTGALGRVTPPPAPPAVTSPARLDPLKIAEVMSKMPPPSKTPPRPKLPTPPPDTRPKPAFLTRGPAPFTAASERQTGGTGKVSTPPAPPTVRVPAASAPVHKGYLGRMDRIDPDEIPF